MIIEMLNNVTFIWNHPMNQRYRLAAIRRFVTTQIAMRISQTQLIHNWIGGTRFIISPGEAGLTQNVYCGLHEHIEMMFLLHLLRADDLFVDIGANVGSYTMLSSGVVGAKSVSIEPVPRTYRKLSDNIRLNHLENLAELHQCGLADYDGQIHFTSDQNCTNHVATSQETHFKDIIVVPVKTADDLLKTKQVTAIKIDVEGYETVVLKGANTILAQPSVLAVIMELNGSGTRYGFDEAAIVDLMRNHGFETATYEPFTREVVLLEGKCLNSGNTLFLRNTQLVKVRVRNARTFEINGLSI